MSRMALAATSLVAAIPAGILAALGIMAFLSHTEHMKPMVMVVLAGTTLTGILISLMPAAILVGKGQKKPKAAAVKEAKEARDEPAVAAASGAQTAEIVAEVSVESEEIEDTEAMSDDLSGSTGEFQFEEDAFLDEDMLEPEPEPEPKKKKKKR